MYLVEILEDFPDRRQQSVWLEKIMDKIQYRATLASTLISREIVETAAKVRNIICRIEI